MNARVLPYLLILPVTLFLCLFFLYPFVLVAQQAFFADGQWSLTNFREVTGYWKFPVTIRNTLLLAAAVVPIQLVLALLMATMVGKMQKGRDLVLYIWTIPLGISDLAADLTATIAQVADELLFFVDSVYHLGGALHHLVEIQDRGFSQQAVFLELPGLSQ